MNTYYDSHGYAIPYSKDWGSLIGIINLKGSKIEGDIGANGIIIADIYVTVYMSEYGDFNVRIESEYNQTHAFNNIQETGEDPTILVQKIIKRLISIACFFNGNIDTIPQSTPTDIGFRLLEFLDGKFKSLRWKTFSAQSNAYFGSVHQFRSLDDTEKSEL